MVWGRYQPCSNNSRNGCHAAAWFTWCMTADLQAAVLVWSGLPAEHPGSGVGRVGSHLASHIAAGVAGRAGAGLYHQQAVFLRYQDPPRGVRPAAGRGGPPSALQDRLAERGSGARRLRVRDEFQAGRGVPAGQAARARPARAPAGRPTSTSGHPGVPTAAATRAWG